MTGEQQKDQQGKRIRALHYKLNVAGRRGDHAPEACDGPDCPVCAVLAEALKPEPHEERWQPIESAPKDGTAIIAWRDGGVHVMRWRDLGGDEGFCDEWHYSARSLKIQPTHWMPLPAPPSETR